MAIDQKSLKAFFHAPFQLFCHRTCYKAKIYTVLGSQPPQPPVHYVCQDVCNVLADSRPASQPSLYDNDLNINGI